MGDLKRGDLYEGRHVRLSLNRRAEVYEVGTSHPVNRRGEVVKGGRMVKLFMLKDDGERAHYATLRLVSELWSERAWLKHQHEEDHRVVSECGDGQLLRQAHEARVFFAGLGMDAEKVVQITTHRTMDDEVYVTRWCVMAHRVQWPEMLAELGVIEPIVPKENNDEKDGV